MSKGTQDNLLSGKSSTNLSLFGSSGSSGSTFTTPVTTSDTTDSTSTSTGAIIDAGGLGVAKAAYIGGALHVTDSTQSGATNTGCIQASGGVGIVKNLSVGGTAYVTDTTDSTSGGSGSIFTAGGVGVTKTLFCKDIKVNNGTTDLFKTTSSLTKMASAVGGIINIVSQDGSIAFGTNAIDTVAVGSTGHATSIYGSYINIYGNQFIASTVQFSAVSTLNIPLSIANYESVDYRFALHLSGNCYIQIFANTNTTLTQPKTSIANGVACLSGNTNDNLTYSPLNGAVQTFTITVTKDASWYLFYMNGVMFFQVETSCAATFAGYIAQAGITSFSLTPTSSNTMTGYYSAQNFIQ